MEASAADGENEVGLMERLIQSGLFPSFLFPLTWQPLKWLEQRSVQENQKPNLMYLPEQDKTSRLRSPNSNLENDSPSTNNRSWLRAWECRSLKIRSIMLNRLSLKTTIQPHESV